MDDALKPDFLNSLLVVLVLYEMKINASPAYKSLTTALSLQKNSATFFIYDNSMQQQELTMYPGQKAIYFHDPSNAGVSKAYNEGFKKAKELNKKWLLLADQDTLFPSDIFMKYQESIMEFPTHLLFSPIVNDGCIVSPFRFAWGKGHSVANIRPDFFALSDYKFINSGLLASVNLFGKCNGYDERFPLDFSDLAFIERLMKVVSEFVLIDAVCSHSLSSTKDSKEVTMVRFGYFVRASKTFGRFYGSAFLLSISRFLRAAKLSYQFKSVVFLKLLNQK